MTLKINEVYNLVRFGTYTHIYEIPIEKVSICTTT